MSATEPMQLALLAQDYYTPYSRDGGEPQGVPRYRFRMMVRSSRAGGEGGRSGGHLPLRLGSGASWAAGCAAGRRSCWGRGGGRGSVSAGRHTSHGDNTYFGTLLRARVIVTAEPSKWGVDFRTLESLMAGALVMVDPLYTPHPFPFADGVHVVYYDHTREADLAAKLRHYLAHPVEARRSAVAGHLFALRYHRAVSQAARQDFRGALSHIRVGGTDPHGPSTPQIRSQRLCIRG